MALRVLKWIGIIGIFLFFLIAIGIRFVDFSMSEEDLSQAFSTSVYQPVHNYLNIEDRSIHYVTVGDSTLPAVLFVHGSPGSWTDHVALLSDSVLQETFFMISLDRPGFGESEAGNPERSLPKQAEVVAGILRQENSTAILSGHSYGGPVVVKAAIDYPNLVNGIIIVAGSVDPELEDTKWYQIPVDYQILSWILPPDIYSTNEEILELKDGLIEMTPDWNTIKIPVSIIHGVKDILVPVENAEFAKKQLRSTSPAIVIRESMNHFVPWSNPDLIKSELFRILSIQ